MFPIIIHASLLAFGLILPLGVQNVFIFNQGVIQPTFKKTLPAIITASLCDMLLISAAIMGVSLIVLSFTPIKIILLLAGVCFLIYMGFVTWKNSAIEEDKIEVQTFSARKQIMFALSVSLLNPHAILDTVGVIGTSSLRYEGEEKIIFGIVCMMVSWIWFFGLAIVGRVSGKLDQSGRLILLLNKVSAVIMWGTAMYIGISLVKQ